MPSLLWQLSGSLTLSDSLRFYWPSTEAPAKQFPTFINQRCQPATGSLTLQSDVFTHQEHFSDFRLIHVSLPHTATAPFSGVTMCNRLFFILWSITPDGSLNGGGRVWGVLPFCIILSQYSWPATMIGHLVCQSSVFPPPNDPQWLNCTLPAPALTMCLNWHSLIHIASFPVCESPHVPWGSNFQLVTSDQGTSMSDVAPFTHKEVVMAMDGGGDWVHV